MKPLAAAVLFLAVVNFVYESCASNAVPGTSEANSTSAVTTGTFSSTTSTLSNELIPASHTLHPASPATGTKASLIANNGTAQSPVSDSMSVAADSGISKTENQTSSSIRSSTTNHTTGATGSKLELHSNETTTYAPQLTTSICVTCNQAERNFSGHPRSNPTESWNDRTSGVILKAPTEPNDTENYSTIKPDMSADDSKTMSPLKGKGFLIPVSCVVVVIGIVVIVFLYKMCQRKPPAAESTGPKVSAQNKESVKLLSVKTATPDSDMKRTTPAHHMEFIAEC